MGGQKQIEKRVTLDDIITRRSAGNLDKVQIKFFPSTELGGEIEIRKIPLKKYMRMINNVNDDDMVENVEFMCRLIFECCPLFNQNSQALMEAYECEIPTDLPLEVFNDNIGELSQITEIINGFYGLDKVDATIKNS